MEEYLKITNVFIIRTVTVYVISKKWSEKKMLNKCIYLQEEYAQKVRLGHEEAIRQLEERIQSKLVVAEAKRETEIMKKLETLREHVCISVLTYAGVTAQFSNLTFIFI